MTPKKLVLENPNKIRDTSLIFKIPQKTWQVHFIIDKDNNLTVTTIETPSLDGEGYSIKPTIVVKYEPKEEKNV